MKLLVTCLFIYSSAVVLALDPFDAIDLVGQYKLTNNDSSCAKVTSLYITDDGVYFVNAKNDNLIAHIDDPGDKKCKVRNGEIPQTHCMRFSGHEASEVVTWGLPVPGSHSTSLRFGFFSKKLTYKKHWGVIGSIFFSDENEKCTYNKLPQLFAPTDAPSPQSNETVTIVN